MREFDIINKLFKPLAGIDSAGLSDDCAFFDGYCVTKDILISGVHFFGTDAPYNLARKALRVNLSDLAASGAVPFGFMLGLALTKGTDQKWLEKFTAGLKSDITQYRFQLLGGDTCFHEGELVISVTAIGKCKRPILRSGALVGDNIFISGAIGGGYLGLKAKQKGLKSGRLIDKYEMPEPRLDLLPIIRKKATACTDISDGLLADLGHICDESAVGAEIVLHEIPLYDKDFDAIKQISGGDDYELVFTSKAKKIDGCHKIGEIVRYDGVYLDGKRVRAEGYEHKNWAYQP